MLNVNLYARNDYQTGHLVQNVDNFLCTLQYFYIRATDHVKRKSLYTK